MADDSDARTQYEKNISDIQKKGLVDIYGTLINNAKLQEAFKARDITLLLAGHELLEAYDKLHPNPKDEGVESTHNLLVEKIKKNDAEKNAANKNVITITEDLLPKPLVPDLKSIPSDLKPEPSRHLTLSDYKEPAPNPEPELKRLLLSTVEYRLSNSPLNNKPLPDPKAELGRQLNASVENYASFLKDEMAVHLDSPKRVKLSEIHNNLLEAQVAYELGNTQTAEQFVGKAVKRLKDGPIVESDPQLEKLHEMFKASTPPKPVQVEHVPDDTNVSPLSFGRSQSFGSPKTTKTVQV